MDFPTSNIPQHKTAKETVLLASRTAVCSLGCSVLVKGVVGIFQVFAILLMPA